MSKYSRNGVLFDSSNPYGSSGYDGYQGGTGGGDNLQFYSSNYNDPGFSPAAAQHGGYYDQPGGGVYANMHQMNSPTGFWSAFGTGGYADEPPLLEELGINFNHIKAKSLTVLNPFGVVDKNIMNDADLAGPILFCLLFGIFLLFSGKVSFGYIYGVALVGCLSLYLILNMMSERGIDAHRTASVLGYCLLPLVILSCVGVAISMDGFVGYFLSGLAILWCTSSASAMFVAVLQMREQRLLVAYPIGLLYSVFALLTVFKATINKS